MSDNKGKRVLFSTDRYDLSKQENTPPESPSSQETAAVNSAPAEPIVSPSVSPIASATAEAENVTPPSEVNTFPSEDIPDETVPETPAPKKSGRVGRPPKGETAKSPKKEGKRAAKKSETLDEENAAALYVKLPKKLHKNLNYIRYETDGRVSMASVITTVLQSALPNTYRCKNPACFQEMIAVERDGNVPKPISCPYCGTSKLEKLEFGGFTEV
jgi:hypothetical protein